MLDIFISGELINLCIPSKKFAEESDWYSWFNDESITKYLDQGVFPNTPQSQIKFFDNLNEDRLVLIIVDKNNNALGVISLSFIDHKKKSCDIALVVSNHGDRKLRPYMSLEAMALMTFHAFKKVGVHRINAGQHIGLTGWQNRLELIGYQLEGLHEEKFVKGSVLADSMSIAIRKSNFNFILSNRKGRLWDNLEAMKKRIKKMPKESYVHKLIKIYEKERKNYYEQIFSL